MPPRLGKVKNLEKQVKGKNNIYLLINKCVSINNKNLRGG